MKGPAWVKRECRACRRVARRRRALIAQACRYSPLLRSTLTIEVCPLAGLDEVGPVERMKFRVAPQHV